MVGRRHQGIAEAMCDCGDECQGIGVSRRAFLERSSALALGALLAGCGDGILGGDPGVVTSTGGSSLVTVATLPNLAVVGGVAFVSGASVPLIIVRTGDETFDVFNRRCTHKGTQIHVAGSGFKCPNHGALYTRAGKWSGGFRTSDLKKIAATFDPATGVLTVNA